MGSLSVDALAARPRSRVMDLFSPVNQDGSFDFHRVLKSGEISKRTRKTRSWKRFHLVLRPNTLSMYKNVTEDVLHKQIALSDLTAVAPLKDPKGRRQHMFGLFSPSRNHHFQATNESDARDWVDLIRQQARIDEEEEQMIAGSPSGEHAPYHSIESRTQLKDESLSRQERLLSSSPELLDYMIPATTRDGVRIPGIRKLSGTELDYSGPDYGLYSDFSDPGPARSYADPIISVSNSASKGVLTTDAYDGTLYTPSLRPHLGRNASQQSGLNLDLDGERVIWHGSLLALRSKGGVRAWRRLWAVLRPKNLALYKNEEEYSAQRLIPLSNIVSAVEIDPISRSKAHCMQIIVEDKSYRFCAQNEEDLAKCLGAIKSQLAKRRGKENQRHIVS